MTAGLPPRSRWYRVTDTLFTLTTLTIIVIYLIAIPQSAGSPGSALAMYGLLLLLLAFAATQIRLVQRHANLGAITYTVVAAILSVFNSFFDPTEQSARDTFVGIVFLAAFVSIGASIFKRAGKKYLILLAQYEESCELRRGLLYLNKRLGVLREDIHATAVQHSTAPRRSSLSHDVALVTISLLLSVVVSRRFLRL